jgi:hypothetical protein
MYVSERTRTHVRIRTDARSRTHDPDAAIQRPELAGPTLPAAPHAGARTPRRKRGTEESNLEQGFWRPPCYRYTSPPKAQSIRFAGLLCMFRMWRRPSSCASRVRPAAASRDQGYPRQSSGTTPAATRREPLGQWTAGSIWPTNNGIGDCTLDPLHLAAALAREVSRCAWSASGGSAAPHARLHSQKRPPAEQRPPAA